jgi:hypothetical protein
MATIAETRSKFSPDTGFFLIMAIVMATINVIAFSFFALMGISSFGAPLYVHVHAVVFFGWVAIYTTQNVLAATGATALHRRLGWLAAAWTLLMLVVGTLTTVWTTQRGLVPFFFTPTYFLMMNPITAFTFVGLVMAGVAVRTNTGWHRRLIYCGMATIMGPAFGRLLPPPLLESGAAMLVIIALLVMFPVIGAVRDRIKYRRVHPAWLVGVAVQLAMFATIELLADSAIGVAIHDAVVEGTPGATKPALEKGVFPG